MFSKFFGWRDRSLPGYRPTQPCPSCHGEGIQRWAMAGSRIVNDECIGFDIRTCGTCSGTGKFDVPDGYRACYECPHLFKNGEVVGVLEHLWDFHPESTSGPKREGAEYKRAKALGVK